MKPRVAITVGDPGGIGPEIARKAADDPRVRDVCEPVVYAPPDARGVRARSGVGRIRPLRHTTSCAPRFATHKRRRWTRSRRRRSASSRWRGQGLPWKGHTDLLAHLTGSRRVAMMFWSTPLKVILATVHIPLADVPRVLTRAVLDDTIDLTAQELPRFGIARPRLALAGLNPHAGEEGVLGDEEQRVLRPAVEAARERGIDIAGPFPGDTIFVRASRGEFDAVIACYHDQGLIPVKLLAFGHSVNVTLGLPIVRTSVDHGTAFDIAGKNIADPTSMIEATLLAGPPSPRLRRARPVRVAAMNHRFAGELVPAHIRDIDLPPFDPLNLRGAELRAAGHHVISLGQALPFFPPPPSAMAAARAALDTPQVNKYATDPGLPSLRGVLADRLRTHLGIDCTGDDILITAGANHAFTLMLTTLVSPG
jgi:4-hydroxythreonine-4-phosphate dehydrogenase